MKTDRLNPQLRRTYVFTPESAGSGGAVLYIHGGGMVIGTVKQSRTRSRSWPAARSWRATLARRDFEDFHFERSRDDCVDCVFIAEGGERFAGGQGWLEGQSIGTLMDAATAIAIGRATHAPPTASRPLTSADVPNCAIRQSRKPVPTEILYPTGYAARLSEI